MTASGETGEDRGARRALGRRGFRLGSVLGFEIRIDHSWFVIFFLVLWSLSAGFFPQELPDRDGIVYLLMGTAATLLFFASLLTHELSHSVVARGKGIEVEGITLFIFGGMARTRMESEEPVDEILIAGIGPVTSFVLGAIFFGISWIGGGAGWPPEALQVAKYLGYINVLLAGFNLLPGFPLDGGRLFRAIAWKATGDLTKATRWASTGGQWLGYALMGFGFLQTFGGAVIGGLWLVFIGWFLRGAADMSYQQHLVREALQGVQVRELMSPDPVTLSPHLTVEDLVDRHLLRGRYQSFPVVDDGRVLGLVTLDQVKEVPRDQWAERRISDIMLDADRVAMVAPDADILEVMDRMRDPDVRRVLVGSEDALVGIVSSSDVARWIQRVHDLGVEPRRMTR
jgi:Zn-dependent protease/predicted transcriptional regulator